MLISMFKTVWNMHLIARIGLIAGGIGAISGLLSLAVGILVLIHVWRAEDVRDYAAQMLLVGELLLVFCIGMLFVAEKYKRRNMS